MIGSILVFLLVLSILVLIHELGHFVVARLEFLPESSQFKRGRPFIH
ncbi:MAG: hypothetical protein UX88_C0005G0042 [Candidatus Woesebacteria bacterium GW2011_GWC2_47_16]|uniref:Peptidase M50 domain-containing protein n=1 Tax=Candidatus Woesebacteria bacterium GW2011_GWC2_47_16 TaxID=1618590 RepID=A0A0G1S774_9BACT|nr:MAG: hypothetical protein UX88_C0005G0042 [Candidatus Woesebacteria bacterium GW2011_GWC2_47_16]